MTTNPRASDPAEAPPEPARTRTSSGPRLHIRDAVPNRRVPDAEKPWADEVDVMALGLPVPIANALDNEGIRTLGILRRVPDEALRKIVSDDFLAWVREVIPYRREEGEPEVGRPPGDFSHADWQELAE